MALCANFIVWYNTVCIVARPMLWERSSLIPRPSSSYLLLPVIVRRKKNSFPYWLFLEKRGKVF